MTQPLPSVTFVIPVRNDATRLGQCLQSIARSKLSAVSTEIIVADNGSTDDSPHVARAAGATVLELPGLRVAELRNRAAALAAGKILAFVDADHEIGTGWSAVATDLLSLPGVGAVSAPCVPPHPPSWVQRMYDGFRDHRSGTHDVSWAGAGNMAVKRDVFLALGGFDSTLEACEDVDLCQRLRAAGYRLLADSRLHSIHKGDPVTLGALFQSELWRGRDNLRVSLRGPLSLSALPSIVIPVIDLVCVLAVAIGLVTFTTGGGLTAAVAATVFAVLAALRAARMMSRLTHRRPADFLRAYCVAAVYDFARALALTLQVRHRRAGLSTPASAHQS